MNPLIHQHKKMFIIGGLVVVCLLLAVLRWTLSYAGASNAAKKNQAKAQAAAESRPSVQAFICKRNNFIDNLVLTGTLQGGARVELRFNREGKIGRIHKRVGDTVKKGQTIAELDTSEARIKLQQAESELSQAVDMYRSGAIAKPRLTQAQLAAQLAREEYNRSFIRASRDGSIGELNAEEGEFVSTQMTIASLVSVETVFVEMGVIEKDLGKLHVGQTVKIEVDTYPGIPFQGKITNISPIVEGTSRTRSVRAEIPNPKGTLLPGMFARTKIFVLEKQNVLVIPATALKSSDNGAAVFLLDGTKLRTAPIKIGYESVEWVEVLEGLSEGDRIVATISEKLRDGLSVEPIEERSYEPKSDGDPRDQNKISKT